MEGPMFYFPGRYTSEKQALFSIKTLPTQLFETILQGWSWVKMSRYSPLKTKRLEPENHPSRNGTVHELLLVVWLGSLARLPDIAIRNCPLKFRNSHLSSFLHFKMLGSVQQGGGNHPKGTTPVKIEVWPPRIHIHTSCVTCKYRYKYVCIYVNPVYNGLICI